MGVIVNKENNQNDELTRRIDADLRSRLSGNSQIDSGEVESIEDAEYLKDLKKTGRFAWVWVVLVILAIFSLILIFRL